MNRGDTEGEVVIFGSSDVQQKAKEMIDDLLAKDGFGSQNGMISTEDSESVVFLFQQVHESVLRVIIT